MKYHSFILMSVSVFTLVNSAGVKNHFPKTNEGLSQVSKNLEKRGLFYDLVSLCLSGGFPSQGTQDSPCPRYRSREVFLTRLNATGEHTVVRSPPEAAAKAMWEDLDMIIENLSELNTKLKNRDWFERLPQESRVKVVKKAARDWKIYKHQYLGFGEREWINLSKFKKTSKLIKYQNEITEIFVSSRAFIVHYLRKYSI